MIHCITYHDHVIVKMITSVYSITTTLTHLQPHQVKTGAEMATNRRKRASTQSNRAAERHKSKNKNSTSTHPLPAKPSTTASTVSVLLQPPKKWTARHLEATRLKLNDNALSSTVSSNDHIPRDVSFWTRMYRRLLVHDRDQDFERAAAFFCQPSREELATGPNFMDTSNPFSSAFTYINTRVLRPNSPASLAGFSCFIAKLMRVISGFAVGRDFYVEPEPIIRFTIPGLLARGKLRSHGAYVESHEDHTTSIPLIIFSLADIRSKTDEEILAQYEIPQALLQTILAYSHNQTLEEYTGFVITMDQTVIRVGKAVVSQSYLKSLCTKKPITENLLYYRSAPFELLEREDRREFMRIMFGVLRYLAESDASSMTIDQASFV